MWNVIFAAVILAVNSIATQDDWNNFKLKHGKRYMNTLEERQRYDIFQSNLKTINEHNARYESGLETYWMRVNKFADMTSKEFSVLLKRHQSIRPKTIGSRFALNASVPEAIDWREKNAVTEVKDQMHCWCSWAFSVTGALEGQNAIINKKLVSFSEQQLLDCSGDYGNGNCLAGGNMEFGYDYVIEKGIQTEEDYPYEDAQGTCRASGQSVLKVQKYANIDGNEEALKNAVGTIGPISAAVYSVPIRFYAGGIFRDESCSNDAWLLDQGVLIVGYNNTPSDYWIIKNSWGTDEWGEKGYMRMARNANQCGIALDTSYPIL